MLVGFLANITRFSHENMHLVFGLQNPLSLIHPLLIYVVYFAPNSKKKKITFISTAIIFGGWWATQELNWGAWWNWDFIEIPVLLLWVYVTYQIHSNLSFLKKRRLTFVAIVLCISIFSRFLVAGSIHSFIPTISQGGMGLNLYYLFSLQSLHPLYANAALSLTALQLFTNKLYFCKKFLYVSITTFILLRSRKNKFFYRVPSLLNHMLIVMVLVSLIIINCKNTLYSCGVAHDKNHLIYKNSLHAQTNICYSGFIGRIGYFNTGGDFWVKGATYLNSQLVQQPMLRKIYSY